MIFNKRLVAQHYKLICILLIQSAVALNRQHPKETYLRPGITTHELLSHKGYLVVDHEIVSDDGYVIGLSSATNPLISRKRKDKLKLQPVLFVHGSGVNSNVYMVNSRQAQAKDLLSLIPGIHRGRYADANAVIKLLATEPSIDSLPLLMMNFGYDVWFLHKRGTKQSKRRLDGIKPELTPMQKLKAAYEQAYESGWLVRHRDTNEQQSLLTDEMNKQLVSGAISLDDLPKSSLTKRVALPSESTNATAIREDNEREKGRNSKFIEALLMAPGALIESVQELAQEIKNSLDRRLWNHSCDEQAAYDLPRAVEFILEHSETSQCIYVGDSAGGALGIMTLILNPQMNERLSKVILLSPAFNSGRGRASDSLMRHLVIEPPTISLIGPWPMNALSKPAQVFFQLLCSTEMMQQTLCQFMQSSGAGPSGGQMPIAGEFFSSYLIPVSIFEYFQFIQAFIRKSTHFYDYGEDKNAELYDGSSDAPIYDPRLITNEQLAIWTSKYDYICSSEDMELFMKDLKVKHKYFFIDNQNVTADHSAYVWHKNTGRVFNVPILMDIIQDTK